MNNNLMIEKTYVDVIVKHDKYGNARPISLSIEGSKLYNIDKIKYKCRAASLKVGGNGVRYTIVIEGKILFLYDEENGKWFIESSII